MTEATQQEFGIHTIYLKDVSFEAPNSPAIFQGKLQPQVEMNLGINTQQIGEDLFEVVLSVTVTAKSEDKTAFLVELQQAGTFILRGFADEQMQPMLGIYCPNLLYPFAREAASNLIGKGGFPMLMLEPVNFEALYNQHMQQQQNTAQ